MFAAVLGVCVQEELKGKLDSDAMAALMPKGDSPNADLFMPKLLELQNKISQMECKRPLWIAVGGVQFIQDLCCRFTRTPFNVFVCCVQLSWMACLRISRIRLLS